MCLVIALFMEAQCCSIILVSPEIMYQTAQRVLIVEDDEDMLFLLRAALTKAGYVVETAKVGSGIVDFSHTLPDLFILDKGLPMIDGIAVSKFLRINERTRHIPIVMISGHPLQEKARRAGVDAFIQKPFTVETLLKVVHRYIKNGETHAIDI